MSAGGTFTICFVVIITLWFGMRIFLKKLNNSHAESITYIFDQFKGAVFRNDIIDINRFGLELIWNSKLNKSQMEFLSKNIESRIEEHPQLEKLRLAIYNKKLRWKKTLYMYP